MKYAAAQKALDKMLWPSSAIQDNHIGSKACWNMERLWWMKGLDFIS